MMVNEKHTIHAVAFQHGDHWVAQCLDYDIATQAENLNDLVYEVERIIVAHLLVAVHPAALPIPPEQRPSLELRAA